ncbi:nitrate reductase [Nitratireductor sp. XY-223]|uniref:nitrate reductase n=1 Tax=Nitratireductor sp. XY-223 TaxID=2561926 RepID=UPI0010A9CCEE|nr:nitrate reductase [Nitratireductor sp. XY-223]
MAGREAPEPPTVRTTCPYCGVGCGILAGRHPGGSVSITGDHEHPANFGRLCSKGSALGETVDLDGRLLFPQVDGRRVPWDDALDLVAQRFSEAIASHGPDSVAFYVSGQLLTEDYYVANKLMKGFIGSANIDTNSRLCMASSVAGHRRAFGTDTVPGTYEDLELADLVVVTGSNLAWCHPVLYQRLLAAKAARPQMRVVLIDPRATMTDHIADLHLAIKADGDAALFCGLLAHIAASSHLDRTYIEKHTDGFAAALAAARALSLDEIVRQTGLPAGQIGEFYRLFANAERTVTIYSQGVNQSSGGTDKVNAIINCHLATGRIGRPGAGPFSVTGQPNAMGGREVGGLANMLASHMDIENAAHRDIVGRFWGSRGAAEKSGLKAVDLFRAVGDGRIKALWIMATNPVDSLPDANAVQAALEACPFVVVSDMMADTDTVRHAHVRLPALAWGEKDGTVTNSERRISRQRAFLPPPGEAKPDWWHVCQVARRMGYSEAFDYAGPAEIYREHAALTGFENNGSRDLDIGAHAAITKAEFDRMMPFQWPLRQGQPDGDTRFFADGGFYTTNRRGRFIAVDAARPERMSDAFPLVLNTGRVRDHWHTMTRTAKSHRLSGHATEPYCEMHPDDAAVLGIGAGTLVRVENAHGTVVARALLSDRQARGSVFVPMHWTDQNSARGRINALVPPVIDPVSGQPASKNVAVRVAALPVAHYGYAVLAARPGGDMPDYWALARESGGWSVEFASFTGVGDVSTRARAMAGAAGETELLTYRDEATGSERVALFQDSRLIGAFFFSQRPIVIARAHVAEELHTVFGDPRSRCRVVAGQPGSGRPDPGRIVCSCLTVGVNQINAALDGGCPDADAIGRALGAGTNCGSCRSEIQAIINERTTQAAE